MAFNPNSLTKVFQNLYEKSQALDESKRMALLFQETSKDQGIDAMKLAKMYFLEEYKERCKSLLKHDIFWHVLIICGSVIISFFLFLKPDDFISFATGLSFGLFALLTIYSLFSNISDYNEKKAKMTIDRFYKLESKIQSEFPEMKEVFSEIEKQQEDVNQAINDFIKDERGKRNWVKEI